MSPIAFICAMPVELKPLVERLPLSARTPPPPTRSLSLF